MAKAFVSYYEPYHPEKLRREFTTLVRFAVGFAVYGKQPQELSPGEVSVKADLADVGSFTAATSRVEIELDLAAERMPLTYGHPDFQKSLQNDQLLADNVSALLLGGPANDGESIVNIWPRQMFATGWNDQERMEELAKNPEFMQHFAHDLQPAAVDLRAYAEAQAAEQAQQLA